MRKNLLHLLSGLVLLGAANGANAALVTGTTNIIGFGNPNPPLPNATSVVWVSGTAGEGTGDLAGMDGASTAASTLTLNSFTFNPFVAGTTVWSTTLLGGLNFVLDTVAVVTQNSRSLTLNGTGLFSGAAYDDTPGIFVLTLNKTNGQLTGSISSSYAAVPIPAAAWLFGSALVGLAAVARRGAPKREATDHTV